MNCTCHEVYVGGMPTGSKDIDESCPDHGIGSTYWIDYMERANARLRELYKLRDEARAAWAAE